MFEFIIPDALNNLTPTGIWSMTNVHDYNTLNWLSTDVTKPTQQEVNDELSRLNNQKPFTDCTTKAKSLLAASDWSVLSDVNISNKAEFETYRASLRALMFTPVAEPTFPTEPQPIWV
jgi:hypothetical protein